MAKYRYAIRVKKVVVYSEIIHVNATDCKDACKLAKKEARASAFKDADILTIKYRAEVCSYTVKPVEE